MAATPLDDAEIRRRLSALDGWQLVDGKLDRTYRFASFVTAGSSSTTSMRSM